VILTTTEKFELTRTRTRNSNSTWLETRFFQCRIRIKSVMKIERSQHCTKWVTRTIVILGTNEYL